MIQTKPNGAVIVRAGHDKGKNVPQYEIRRMILSAPGGVVIDEADFHQIQEAQDATFQVIAIEQGFDMVVESYIEFEEELIRNSLRNMVCRDLDYFGFQKQLNSINRRLGATLSAVRSYIDQTDSRLCTLYGKDGEVRSKFNELKSTHYDEHFEYRAMEALRNYSQHNDFIVQSLTHNLKWIDGTEERERILVFSLEPKILPSNLMRQNKLKSSIAEEMLSKGDSINIRFVMKKYISCLGEVHEQLRSWMRNDIQKWEESVNEVFQKYRSAFPDESDTIGLAAIKRNDEKEIVKEVRIFPQFLEYKRMLEEKNSNLKNLFSRQLRS